MVLLMSTFFSGEGLTVADHLSILRVVSGSLGKDNQVHLRWTKNTEQGRQESPFLGFLCIPQNKPCQLKPLPCRAPSCMQMLSLNPSTHSTSWVRNCNGSITRKVFWIMKKTLRTKRMKEWRVTSVLVLRTVLSASCKALSGVMGKSQLATDSHLYLEHKRITQKWLLHCPKINCKRGVLQHNELNHSHKHKIITMHNKKQKNKEQTYRCSQCCLR